LSLYLNNLATSKAGCPEDRRFLESLPAGGLFHLGVICLAGPSAMKSLSQSFLIRIKFHKIPEKNSQVIALNAKTLSQRNQVLQSPYYILYIMGFV